MIHGASVHSALERTTEFHQLLPSALLGFTGRPPSVLKRDLLPIVTLLNKFWAFKNTILSLSGCNTHEVQC